MPQPKHEKPKSKIELWTLNDVANCPSKISSTLGVILDATGIYKTNKSFDFVIKLRIIDESFNIDDNKHHKIVPYIMLFLYFSDKDDGALIPKLGDIILLRNFIFDVNEYKNLCYLTGSYNKSCSTWQIYDGAECASAKALLKDKDIIKIFDEERSKLDGLRAWRTKFFNKKSLLDVNWYHLQLPFSIDHCPIVQFKDVDILLKLVTAFKLTVNAETYHRLAFCDINCVMHFCEINSSELSFKEGMVYKLRSVVITNEKCSMQKRVNYYEHSAFLRIPECFKDFQSIQTNTQDISYSVKLLETQFFSELHLDKYAKESFDWGVSVFKNDLRHNLDSLKEAAIGHFPSLADFNLNFVELDRAKESSKHKKRIGSVFDMSHDGLAITDLIDLDYMLKKCVESPENASDYIGKLYRVRVGISEIEPRDINNFCKFYCPITRKTFLLDQFNVLKVRNALDIIFDLNFKLTDKTLDKSKFLPVYLFTDDNNPKEIFELWQIFEDFDNLEDFVQKSGKYEKQLNENFKQMVHNDFKFDLVLQFIQMEVTPSYFKIVDSKFWFF